MQVKGFSLQKLTATAGGMAHPPVGCAQFTQECAQVLRAFVDGGHLTEEEHVGVREPAVVEREPGLPRDFVGETEKLSEGTIRARMKQSCNMSHV